MPTYPSAICNGLWEYRPDFSKETWRKGATSVENITAGSDGLAAEEGKKGTIIWTMRSPYVFVGGRLEAEGTGAKFSISVDGKTWQAVKDNLDKFFSVVGPARYEYKLKCQLEGPARLRRLAIVNDLQMAPLALPEMAVGENAFTYSDQSAEGRKVRITHRWVERSASRPPQAPAAAVDPPDGGESDGTDVVFQWTAAQDPDGDAIADYHFELSSRADMRWPLSMCFYKLISRTADVTKEKDKQTGQDQITAKAQYTLPQPGLLTPDRQYYWHVRAMDDKGVWGPWSKTWSFTARGPAYPLDVALDYDQAKAAGTLRWKANPLGRPPVKYRVYGSDEKGFTDRRSAVPEHRRRHRRGNGGLEPVVPGELHRRDHGHGTGGDRPRRRFARGQQDLLPRGRGGRARQAERAVRLRRRLPGPSSTASPCWLPRSAPSTAIRSMPFVPSATSSSRMKGGDQVSGYFDIEKPKFALDQGPAWLKIDEATGVLSGTPDATGKVEVTVTATIDRKVRKLDEKALVWGNEKVLATNTERVGTATQKFVIDVQ